MVSLIVPYRLAFTEEDPPGWVIAYFAIDCFFFFDILLCFFTTFQDKESMQEITDRKEIAMAYIRGWFFIDLFSVVPFDYVLAAGNFNQLLRFAKIGKLYKLIRMTRLAKVFKLLKSKKNVISQFTFMMKINSGLERLIFFSIFFFFFFHISACMFVVCAQIEGHRNSWLNPEVQQLPATEQYIMSCYFVVTTISTVGYGDISANTNAERIFCMFLQFIGVSSFTFMSGALSSIISNYDSSQAALQEKLLFLNKLRTTYSIPNDLYLEINKALKYDN